MYVISHISQLRQFDQEIKATDFNQLENTQKEIKELIGNQPCARTPWAMVFAVFSTMLSIVGPYILWFEIITGDNISSEGDGIMHRPEVLVFIISLITAVHYLAKGFYNGVLAVAGIWFLSFCIAVSGSLITLFNYENYITSGGVALSSMGMICGSLSFLLFNRKSTYEYILFAYHNRILCQKIKLENRLRGEFTVIFCDACHIFRVFKINLSLCFPLRLLCQLSGAAC